MLLPQSREIVYPDYNNSIVNFMSSIVKNFNVKPNHAPLKQIDFLKLKEKQNVVILIFDGMGYEQLQKYADKDNCFILKHCISPITSVCPSSTAAAITSIMTETTPIEHGNLGWTLFFKEFGQYIQLLPMKEHIERKNLDLRRYEPMKIIQINNIFRRIAQAMPELLMYHLSPIEIAHTYYTYEISNPARKIDYSNIKNSFSIIEALLKRNRKDKKFIMSYSYEPDMLLHLKGTDSKSIAKFIEKIDQFVLKLIKNLKGSNTALFIIADHGLKDISTTHFINEDKELYDCILLPTFPEKRFFSYFIKNNRRAFFEKHIEKFRKDFIILTHEEMLESGILGKGKMHYKVDDFIGDYVFIAIGDAQKDTIFEQLGKNEYELRATHAGLTRDEMLVPLIQIDI